MAREKSRTGALRLGRTILLGYGRRRIRHPVTLHQPACALLCLSPGLPLSCDDRVGLPPPPPPYAGAEAFVGLFAVDEHPLGTPPFCSLPVVRNRSSQTLNLELFGYLMPLMGPPVSADLTILFI